MRRNDDPFIPLFLPTPVPAANGLMLYGVDVLIPPVPLHVFLPLYLVSSGSRLSFPYCPVAVYDAAPD